MLENLKPERVFHYFGELTKISRGPGNEQAVSDFLYKTGKELGPETIQDESNNIIIRKLVYPDYVDHPAVIIQGYMDMAAEKADGVDHDFLIGPIPLVVDGDRIKAEGTTLGADDGIAGVIGLAVMEDRNAKHPAFELLVTTNEETTMVGARAPKRENIKGRKLLNIDAEAEGILLSGCSGGYNIIGTKKLNYVDSKMKNTFVMNINSTLGGHSGMEIHQQRGNPIKFAREALKLIEEKSPVTLVSIEGGIKHNAIPRDAKVVFSSNEDDYDVDFSSLITKHPLDKDVRVKIEKCENAEKVLDENDKKDILSSIEEVPHGVYSMMKEYPDIIECSNNLAIFEIKDDVLKVTISLRSSNPETSDIHTEDVSKVYEKCGFEARREDYYKPWAFVKDFDLRNLASKTYKDLFGKEMKVEVVYAALEPVVFIDTFPDMEMIPTGPTMKDVYSPKERPSIELTQRTYEFVKSLLEGL